MSDDKKEILPEGISEEELEARVNAVLAESNNKVKTKQRRRLIGTIVTIFIEIIVLMVFIVAVSTAANDQRFWMFGFSFSVVITESMSPEIEPGDFIIVQQCDIGDIKEGDNIVFTAGDSFGAVKGQGIVHKVMSIEERDGKVYLTTKGVNPNIIAADPEEVTEDNFVGRQVFKSSVLGAIYMFLSNYINWLFIIILLAVLWLAYSQMSKLIKNIKKGNAELEADRASLPDEPGSKDEPKNED